MRRLKVGLIGNPNCGKTTLFNALTGSRQRVGNWPGVTVERKSGLFKEYGQEVEIIDLPGIYSLSIFPDSEAIDEKIAAEYILSDQADIIVNVIDANNLERNLYLTSQLLELDIPLVAAVNMVDVAEKHGITIEQEQLTKQLGCKVVKLVSNKKQGVKALKAAIVATYSESKQQEQKSVAQQLSLRDFRGFHSKMVSYPSLLNVTLSRLTQQIITTVGNNKHSYFLAVRLLEGDVLAKQKLSPAITEFANSKQREISSKLGEDIDVLIADARYGAIHNLVAGALKKSKTARQTVTNAIDRIALNRILGLPVFLLVMYLMFLFAVGVGGKLQGFFQQGGDAVFGHGFHFLLLKMGFPWWLITMLTSGIGKGITTTITFIPVLAGMFLFLALLEDSGYMARAGFVVDRLMQAIGLPGKSFVPMLVGFGCNVPAIMTARTLRNNHERILTIIMTPFMSCGARLAVYAIFTAAFFPKNGQNVVFSLYLIGISVAVLSGVLFRKTILRGEKTSLVTELPTYHLPTIREVALQTWCRLTSFIVKAGKIIVPVCLVISMLNSFNINNNSLLATIGKTITPVFKPMGIKQDNWPATVGLLTGVMAKEVVVGALNTLYASPVRLHESRNSIYGNMYKKFNGPLAAFAYLLFVLLYFPCVPTLVMIFRELNWRWAVFSMVWNTGVAYLIATAFYQLARLLI